MAGYIPEFLIMLKGVLESIIKVRAADLLVIDIL